MPGPAAVCLSQRKQWGTSQFANALTWDSSLNPGHKPVKQAFFSQIGDGERQIKDTVLGGPQRFWLGAPDTGNLPAQLKVMALFNLWYAFTLHGSLKRRPE